MEMWEGGWDIRKTGDENKKEKLCLWWKGKSLSGALLSL